METAFLVKHPLSLGVKAMSKHLLSAVARAALVAEDDAFERLLLFLCLFCLGLVRRNHPTLTSLLDVYTFACVCVCVLYLGLCVLNMERRSRGGEGGRKREEEGRREGGRRRRKEKRGEDESSSTTKQASSFDFSLSCLVSLRVTKQTRHTKVSSFGHVASFNERRKQDFGLTASRHDSRREAAAHRDR